MHNVKQLGMMWNFLTLGGQKSSFDLLKKNVDILIEMMTQKTAGQRPDRPNDAPWKDMETVMNCIICEAVALVLDEKCSAWIEVYEKSRESNVESNGIQPKSTCHGYYECPTCDEWLDFRQNSGKRVNFCPCCGVKLNWDDI